MAALDRDLLNGKGASKDADKLARANYSDRAVAALPDGRRMGQSILDLLGEFRPDRVGIHTLRKMTKTAAIKMAMHYGQAPLVTADYSFPCDDPRISAAVKENYDQIHVPLMKIALNSWVYGNQGAIKQYEYGRLESTYENDDGNVRPVWPDEGVDPVLMATPIPLPQELTQPELTKGRFSGIRTSLARINSQDAATENSDLVPVEWSLWFAHLFEENYRNYFGESRLLPAYEPWYAYWVNWHNRNRHADQDADPALQVWYPPGSSPDGQGGKVENRDAALTAGRELRNGSTVAWPSDVYYDDQGRPSVIKKWEAAFLTGGENITAFSDLLKELEVAMFRACMVPEQTLIEAIQGTGARNVAATQAELFIMSLEIESVYLDRIFNRYLIRPFIEANFGKDPRQSVPVFGANGAGGPG